MGLLLKNILFLSLLLTLMACSKEDYIKGDWQAVDEKKNYSELFIKTGIIRICSDAAGIIPPISYYIEDDSLFSSNLNYQIIKVNNDSLVLKSIQSTLYLRRIENGVKLSDFTDKNVEDAYRISFNERMYGRKGIVSPNYSGNDSITTVEEEIIEIKQK